MEIQFREITADNFYDVCLLTTNGNGIPTFDEEFICCNAVSIAESKYYPLLQTEAIYNGENLIGFILSGPYFKDDGNFWVLRYMIDHKYQGKGYGKKAFISFIEKIKNNRKINKIYIGLDPDNQRATSLYSSLGFRSTGEQKDGENLYILEL
ncbi:GNAT family N-acetyltransferase [Empedobacter brevis]|uniref:Diamine N-acetyltransferase n=1 Tax=Empedobacter brevis NBRC 14943 = ATCC 43319 TaxID=1218108 RepID=A0A511NK06_9FLAO|nr:GNAT family N-acetyltransferase [Empedobacter brevis]GEM53152.1 diamine N-acetyltransferase [Empedobacter brevis NBRC 14943 = ATCC 43319]